ncbi:NACHT domain-containing protein [Actinomadura rudentiformis]|uniref:Uncharacterized protein n=1 Tax=Actinomadura rudentiformis TaxID=359158 RepID=A0A6H9YMX4_9ACTN|nr:hypothetical protein [Actinomadura rudentiformis]KAB2343688.1 hypothetical protein F8566_33730 [Actinomadura rudentiformis]
MTPEEIARSAENWYREHGYEDPRALAARLAQAMGDSRLNEHARTPLHLSMACELFAVSETAPLPVSRTGLYRRFIDLRCGRLPAGGGLRGLAHELRDGQSLLELAQTYFHPPDQVVGQLLEPSGLFVRHGADYRFVDASYQDYLCAEFIQAERTGWLSRRRYLRPRDSWPERDLRVAAFLIGLWLEDGQDLGRWLRLLLRRKRNRVASLRLLAMVVDDGVPLPDAIRTGTVQRLQQLVAEPFGSPGTPDGWSRLVEALDMVDPEQAQNILDDVVRRSHTHGPGAAELLLRRDRRRALDAMAAQIQDRQMISSVRARMLELLTRQLPPEEAAQARAVAALDPSMGEAGVQQATAVLKHDPARGLDLLEHQADHSDWNDEARFKAARELFGQDPARAVPLLKKLGLSSARSPQVRYDAGRLLGADGNEVFRELALDSGVHNAHLRINAAVKVEPAAEADRCLASIAKEGGLDPAGRLAAGSALFDRDRVLGLEALEPLVIDRSTPVDISLEAASTAASADGGACLDRLAGAKERPVYSRKQAAILLRRYKPAWAAKHLSELALNAKMSNAERVNTATAAAGADRETGEQTLVALATKKFHNPDDQLNAVGELKKLNPAQATKLLVRFAGDWRGPSALDAALAIDSRRQRITSLAKIADRSIDTTMRLQAIGEVGKLDKREATHLYERLLGRQRHLSGHDMLEVALAFHDHEHRAAAGHLKALAGNPKLNMDLRKRANSCLPRSQQVDLDPRSRH